MRGLAKREKNFLAWFLVLILNGAVLDNSLLIMTYASNLKLPDAEQSIVSISQDSVSDTIIVEESISEPTLLEECIENTNEKNNITDSQSLFADFACPSSNDFTALNNGVSGSPYDCVWYQSNCVFEDDELKLVIDRDKRQMYNYSAGQYQSNQFCGYGTYEVMMKPIKNDGVVSSFFTRTDLSDNNPWDEIDIEFLGKDTTKVQFNYYSNGMGNHEFLYDLNFDASEQYHFYGFRWEAGKIIWLIDGEEVHSESSNIPSHAGKIVMNVWPGTDVDDWLNPYDGTVPLMAHYRILRYTPIDDLQSLKPMAVMVSQPVAETTVSAGSVSGNLNVSAVTSNGSIPSYEWFRCDNAQKENPVSVGNDQSFAIPTTLSEGNFFYFCRVSATGAESVDSHVAKVIVEAQQHSISAPSIQTQILEEGMVETQYIHTLTATGEQPITWSIADGELPQGLSLSENQILGTPVKAETATFTIQAENAGGFDRKNLSIKVNALPAKNGTITVKSIPNQYYTGAPLTPKTEVYDGGVPLMEDKDYTLSYKNNCNAGKALMFITGKNGYAGEKKTVEFTIEPKKMSDGDMILDDICLAANGKVQQPIPQVYHGIKKLCYKKNSQKNDYIVSYSMGDCKTAGEYIITVSGKNNYCGEKTCKLILTDKIWLNKAKIIYTKSMKYNDGKMVEPSKLTVKLGKKILEKDQDYKVTYRNNQEIGTATAIITGINEYDGIRKVNYRITGTSMSRVRIAGIKKKEYTGEPIYQKDTDGQTESSYTITYRGKQLVLHQDYELSYQKNIEAGKAIMIFTGKGAYSGVLKKRFTILPYQIEKSSSNKFLVDDSPISVPLAKGGAKPKVKVYFNNHLLQEKIDYTLSYQNNKTVNDGSNSKKIPYIIIKGKGDFKGKVTKSFVITALND